MTFLREKKLWSNDDPLFPATCVALGKSHLFEAAGLEQKHWETTSPIRTIFSDAFSSASLPYFNPHSFRNTLVRLGETVCRTPEDFKAWSQNLGHEGVLTTFNSYGNVPDQRQEEIIQRLAKPQPLTQMSPKEFAQEVARELNSSKKDGNQL